MNSLQEWHQKFGYDQFVFFGVGKDVKWGEPDTFDDLLYQETCLKVMVKVIFLCKCEVGEKES